jgi:peptidyl-prolyl cis-trans isomerase SurA
MIRPLHLIIFILSSFCLSAQPEGEALFSVEGNPVPLSEFTYIYEKTNTGNADYSRQSLEEYLDLYIKFKLKVARAREIQMDTISSLNRELESYRRQLANTYLIDKEVTERLTREVYERTKFDVDLSHIVVRLDNSSTPEDSVRALTKISQAKEMAGKGELPFERIVKRFSEDGSTVNLGGKLGYSTAPFPNGFYELENTAYTMEVGEIRGPIASPIGYHILRLEDRRPAYGEMEVAHLLIRNTRIHPQRPKIVIDSLKALLEAGADWDKIVEENSEDKLSANKGGYVGFVRINVYEESFERNSFGLKDDGQISEPFKTQSGWHLVKRIKHRGIGSYEESKRKLQSRISRDGRFELAKKALIEKIKKTAGVHEDIFVLDKYRLTLNKEFLTFRWRPDTLDNDSPLIAIGKDLTFTLADFKSFCMKKSAQRTQKGERANLRKVYNQLFRDFSDDCVLQYEESQLPKKYNDFKNLMNEYEEGILLFEVTKQEVWDKASQDTAGLTEYFERNRGRYFWPERAELIEYTIKSDNSKQIKKIKKKISKEDHLAVTNEYNTDGNIVVSFTKDKVIKNKSPKTTDMEWKEGALRTYLDDNGQTRVLKIDKIIPETQKSLSESRGFVMADYQEELEKKWVEGLRKKYSIDINQPVFDSLIK